MAEKRTIGLVVACPFPSSQGSQVLVRQLSRSLVRLGHTVHVIAYPFGDISPDPEYHLHRSRNLIPYRKFDPGPSLLKPLLDLMLLFKAISVIRREKIDIVHGHNYEGVLVSWPVARYLGLPLVYYCHSLLADELPTYFGNRFLKGFARRIGRLVDRITVSIPDHIIAVSPRTVEDLRKIGAPSDAVTCIPPGIDPGEWPRSTPTSEDRPEGPVVIYTGNLARFQNIPHLLEVLRRVAGEYPDVLLTIVTPSDSTELRSLSETPGIGLNLNIVNETDFQAIQVFLLRADIACSTRTMTTGFAVKNLNYMAAGLPVVCYESGAAGVVDGESGIVLADNDIEGYAGALLKLLRDPGLRKKMGERAREIVFRDYRWDRLTARVEKIHDQLRITGSKNG